ncbi:MAG TPA: DUF4337 domain-containing protein [Verrucomicrobiales bacterium]|jgi:hypothetical protein|nr:DUF4337 domain-containing protein [Verrucomicrobiales bacterium]
MSDLAETIQGASESASESRLNNRVALMVSLSATFMALCNVKDGNVVQAMQTSQTEKLDQWSYFQAKSTKQVIANNAKEMVMLQMETQPGLTPEAKNLLSEKVKKYEEQIVRYEGEKADIMKKAEGFQEEYDEMNTHDDQFDMAEACLSVGIALAGVAALAKRNALFIVGSVFAGFGFVLGLAGFFKWNLHPEWLARLLT